MTLKQLIKAVYDNDRYMDRYTIVFNIEWLTDKEIRYYQLKNTYPCIGLANNFYQHTECTIGNHLGQQINFNDLPKEIKQALLQSSIHLLNKEKFRTIKQTCSYCGHSNKVKYEIYNTYECKQCEKVNRIKELKQ